MSEQESMSERELADFLAESVYSGQPRSVSEAIAAADAAQAEAEPEPEPTPEPPPIVVEDAPTQRDTEEDIPAPPLVAEPELEPESEDDDLDTEGDENVVWATKKYGDDPAKWAKAARDQEQHISRLAAEKKEAEGLAAEWYQYSQQVEQQATQAQAMAMPLSSQEEEWIESAVLNPMQAAMQAAMSGNVNLYNGVINRIAEENPMAAAQVGAAVERQMEQMAYQQQQQYQPPSLTDAMGESIQRLGIDLSTYGEPMSAKVAELGEHHPYVQTILEGDPNARDIALMAVYDLVRSTAMSTRRVRSAERDEQIRHEAELRRQAAGVVTGGPEVQAAPPQNPMLQAMEEEWKARGQWADE